MRNIILIVYSLIYSIILLIFIILTREDLHSLNLKSEEILSSKNCFLENICNHPLFEYICNDDC